MTAAPRLFCGVFDRFQLLNLLAFVLNCFFTYGGNGGLFGGMSNGDLADKYEVLLSPSGFAFSIWGVIFISEGIFTVWQALPAQRGSQLLEHVIGYWWCVACIAQAAWAVTFPHEVFWLAAIFLCAIATALGRLYVGFDVLWTEGCGPQHHHTELHSSSLGENNEDHTTASPAPSCCWQPVAAHDAQQVTAVGWWLIVFPFATHFGWVVIASILNINICFARYGSTGATAQSIIAGISLAAAILISGVLALPRKDPVLVGVAAWGLLAIGAELRKKVSGNDLGDGILRQGSRLLAFGVDTTQDFSTACFVLSGVMALMCLVFSLLAARGVFCTDREKQPSAHAHIEQETAMTTRVVHDLKEQQHPEVIGL